MDELNLDELDLARSRWVPVGKIEIHVRYRTPIETDSFRRKLQSDGIAKFDRQGRFDYNPGRGPDFYRAMAEFYVLGWRGNLTGAGDKTYTPEKMGQALSKVAPLLDAFRQAIQDDERFFESAGNGSTASSGG